MDYLSVTEELPFQDLHGIKTCAGAGEQQHGVSSQKKQKNGEESYKSIRLQKYMGRFQELYGIELMCWFGFQPIPNISEKVSTGRNRVRTVDGFKLRGGHQHRLSFRIYIYRSKLGTIKKMDG